MSTGVGKPAPAVDSPSYSGGGRGWGWQKTQGAGALGVIATMFLVLLRIRELDPFLLILGGPFAVGLLVRLKFRRTGTVIIGILSLAFTVMQAPFLVTELARPEGGVDFLLPAAFLLSMLTALVATIPAYREIPHGPRGSAAPRAVAIGAAVLLMGLSTWALVSYATYESAVAKAGDLRMVMEDFEFAPEKVEASGGEVAIYLENKDDALHTFTIERLGVDVSVPAGKTTRVTFKAGLGTYRFYCIPHAPDMEGNLTVR